jgi:hypothetical protein
MLPLSELLDMCVLSVAVTARLTINEWFSGFSSYDRLLRVVARVYQFIHRCRRQAPDLQLVALTRDELDAALRVIVIESQRFFGQLIHDLTLCHRVSNKPLARLCSFIDPNGIIRVRGRLRNS